MIKIFLMLLSLFVLISCGEDAKEYPTPPEEIPLPPPKATLNSKFLSLEGSKDFYLSELNESKENYNATFVRFKGSGRGDIITSCGDSTFDWNVTTENIIELDLDREISCSLIEDTQNVHEKFLTKITLPLNFQESNNFYLDYKMTTKYYESVSSKKVIRTEKETKKSDLVSFLKPIQSKIVLDTEKSYVVPTHSKNLIIAKSINGMAEIQNGLALYFNEKMTEENKDRISKKKLEFLIDQNRMRLIESNGVKTTHQVYKELNGYYYSFSISENFQKRQSYISKIKVKSETISFDEKIKKISETDLLNSFSASFEFDHEKKNFIKKDAKNGDRAGTYEVKGHQLILNYYFDQSSKIVKDLKTLNACIEEELKCNQKFLYKIKYAFVEEQSNKGHILIKGYSTTYLGNTDDEVLRISPFVFSNKYFKTSL